MAGGLTQCSEGEDVRHAGPDRAERWRRDLRASSTFWVRLRASLPVLEERERARTKGQQLGNSRGHFDVLAGEKWDLVIDTDDHTPSETAAQIVKALGIVN